MFKKFRQNFAQIKLIFIRQEKENDIYTKKQQAKFRGSEETKDLTAGIAIIINIF